MYGLPESGTQIEDLTTGESLISVFPNPTNDMLEVKLANGLMKFIRVFSVNGQLLQSFEPGSAKTVLDLSFLNAGFYLLEVQDMEGNTFKEKVIVN